MGTQQHSHIKRIVGDYLVSYGVIQSVYDSCDVIDFFKISEHKYGLYLADVSGTGSASVAVMNKLQGLINKHCFACLEKQSQCILDPALLVKNINEEMYTAQLGKYVTLIYGVLDLEKNTLNYTIAGFYPNPILVNDKFHAKYLFGKGYPLGILPKADFENFTLQIEPDNSIIFFSDGIMRFFMPGEDVESKDNGLLNLVCSSKVEIDDILQKLDLTYSTPIIDDIVIFTIKRTKKAK